MIWGEDGRMEPKGCSHPTTILRGCVFLQGSPNFSKDWLLGQPYGEHVKTDPTRKWSTLGLKLLLIRIVSILFVCLFVFCLGSLLLFRATPVTDGSSQARGHIGTAAAGLCHSHTGSKLHLRPTPQLTAMLDP